ncbi:MAG: hypothetical protein MZV70_45980 [Desulfobacterales bacterium]|nr:hypothetical protein [Desulfobacterales bacterium]
MVITRGGRRRAARLSRRSPSPRTRRASFFDLPGIRSPYSGEQRTVRLRGPVQLVRHMAYPDKVRLVIDTQKPYLRNYSVEAVDNGLIIQVGDSGRRGQRQRI